VRIATLPSLGLTAIPAAAFAPAADTAQTQASGNDPLSLFTRAFPGYTGPRCLGCHGLVIPERTTVQQSGSRVVRVRFANGRYVSNAQVLGSITITKTITAVVNGVQCQTIITSTANYADKDDAGPEHSNLGITALAMVEIKFEAGSKYTVTVRMPEETHHQIDGGSVQDGCAVGLQSSSPEALTTTWPGTSFVFRGTLPDPNDRRRLLGTRGRRSMPAFRQMKTPGSTATMRRQRRSRARRCFR
jgi:hypothetical protein